MSQAEAEPEGALRSNHAWPAPPRRGLLPPAGGPSLLMTLPSLLSTLGDDELEIIFVKLTLQNQIYRHWIYGFLHVVRLYEIEKNAEIRRLGA